MEIRNFLTIAAVILAVPSLSAPAFAQQSTQSGTRSQGGLEEIVVSARKQQESILNVPVIETAIPSAQLERSQTFAIQDLQKVVPGLNIGRNIHTVGTQVSIRGIGTTASDQGVDSSIALNIDGLTLANGLAFGSGMFDLGQIEVMKGPQSLFYGKASPGGVIALRTADPTDKFEVIGRAGYDFESINPRLEAIVSGPVNDTLKIRLAGLYSHTKGYFNNIAVASPGTGAITPHKKEGGVSGMFRATVLWNPTDKLSARIKFNYVHDRYINAEMYQLTNCPNGMNFSPLGRAFISGDDCKLDRNIRTVYMDPAVYPYLENGGVPFMSTYQHYGSGELNYALTPELNLNSTTGLFQMGAKSLLNSTHTTGAGPALVSESFYGKTETTEEVRLTSDFKSAFNFTAGGYFESGAFHNHVLRFGNPIYGEAAFLADQIDTVHVKTYSVFGQARYKIVPQLELAAGVRWTDEARTQNPQNYNLVTLVASPFPLAVPRIHSATAVPEFTITYRPTDDMTFFAAYKKAYKSGSFSIGTLPALGQDNSFGDEKVKGGEVGMKSRFLDRRLSFNVAGYYYHFAGLQSGVVSPAANGLPVIRTVNAGSARTYGIDMDGAYRPESIDGLTINAAVNWNNARYITLNNVPCWGGQTIALGCNQILNPVTGLYTAQNLNGTPLVRAPDWQINGGFEYEMPIMGDYTLTISNNNSFMSSFRTSLAIGRAQLTAGSTPDNTQKAYYKGDLSVALHSPNDVWEIALIGKNITDTITAGQCSSSNLANGAVLGGVVTGGTAPGIAGYAETSCASDPGREIWIRLTVRPFAGRD